MRFERYSEIEGFSGSVVVEMDGHGRLWLGLPVREREENGFSESLTDFREDSRIDPGHLGRDGEWW